jgi:hypothetical protein
MRARASGGESFKTKAELLVVEASIAVDSRTEFLDTGTGSTYTGPLIIKLFRQSHYKHIDFGP